MLYAKSKSINSFASLFEMTVTVALSKTDRMLKENDAMESPAEECRSRLFDVIGDTEILSETDLPDTTVGDQCIMGGGNK